MISGESLRILRTWKGLAQKQAARLLGISQPAYSKWEKRKKIEFTMQEKIKKAFKCTDSDMEKIKNLAPPPFTTKQKYVTGFQHYLTFSIALTCCVTPFCKQA